MKQQQRFAATAIGVLSAMLFAAETLAQDAKPAVARNVVLVHGAWADGSSWGEVIPRLQAAGLHVTAVQNPLTSLADSVAATRRELALQNGPTVLVAHSWGGTVISETGTDPKVTSLVYVAARATTRGRISSRCPELSPPCRWGEASRSTMASPIFRVADVPHENSTEASPRGIAPHSSRSSPSL
jgi:pimeloyl-ACP methyl ester carboxylesterase